VLIDLCAGRRVYCPTAAGFFIRLVRCFVTRSTPTRFGTRTHFRIAIAMVLLGILSLFGGTWLSLGSEAKIMGKALVLGGQAVSSLGLIWLMLQGVFRK
jgi:hypothetical protein